MWARAYKNFLSEAELAIDKATSASYAGSGYNVELFENGTYRVLWNNHIGNLYVSKGIIISIPTLRDDEMAIMDEEGNEICSAFYDNALEELERNFEYATYNLEGYFL